MKGCVCVGENARADGLSETMATANETNDANFVGERALAINVRVYYMRLVASEGRTMQKAAVGWVMLEDEVGGWRLAGDNNYWRMVGVVKSE